MCIVFNSAV